MPGGLIPFRTPVCVFAALSIEGFGDSRLKDIVPGRQYDFYFLFHGIVQHSLYHGGQIAMLKRAVSP